MWGKEVVKGGGDKMEAEVAMRGDDERRAMSDEGL